MEKMAGEAKTKAEAEYLELFNKHAKDGILNEADFIAMRKEQ